MGRMSKGPMRQMLDNLQRVSVVTGLSMGQIADVFDAMGAAQAEPEEAEPPTENTVEAVLHWLQVAEGMVKH